MKVSAIIPARYASTRFPGKPLARDTGKFLIQHVYERAASAESIAEVIVATDDDRIVRAVRSFGGRVEMTSPDHPTGTDRVAECAGRLDLNADDLVLNVQGDEPEIEPAHLDALVARMQSSPGSAMGTLACRFPSSGPRDGPGSPADPNCVKVVIDASGTALYFSRSLVPYPRDTGGKVDDPARWWLHVGIYAYRPGFLRAISGLQRPGGPDGIEDMERLEQLRALSLRHSFDPPCGPIAVETVDRAAVGVDTPADYAAFVRRYSGRAKG